MRTALPLALLLLAGCAQLWDTATVAKPGAVFPHSADYKDGTVHGPDALPLDEAGCFACHRDEGTTAPPCTKCHELFPHPHGWRDGSAHGAPLIGPDGADTTTCAPCHLTAGMQAATLAPCDGCHASYPHPANWADPGVHGVYALARGGPTVPCGTCHGADLQGGDAGVACNSCHAVYPHAADWKDPDNHGTAARADLASCFACHGEGGSGGTSGVPCDRCHATFPHPADWKQTHLAVADKVGEATCLACHDPGDGPPTMVAGCGATCHGGTP